MSTTTAAAPAALALHWRERAVLITAGCAALMAGLLPAMLVPIQADDLVFVISDNANSSSMFRVIEIRFMVLNDIGRTTFGSAVGAGASNWTEWHVSTWLGVPLLRIEILVTLFWVIAAVASTAWFCAEAWAGAQGASRSRAFARAFLAVAIVVAAVVQIHSRWSNDPVVSYAPWGFGSAAIGFAYLALLFRLLGQHRVSVTSLGGLAIVGSLVGLWYEMLWPLFCVAVVVVAISWFAWRRRGDVRRSVVILTSGVALPAVAIVLLRASLNPDGPSTYPGTRFELSVAALVAFGRGMLGTLPGAAWPLAGNSTHENGTLDLDWRPVLATLVIALCALVGHRVLRSPVDATANFGTVDPQARRLWWLPLVALVMFWVGCVVTVAFTEKYTQELYRLGTVYMFYVPATFVLAAGVFGLISRIRWRPERYVLVALCLGLVSFVFVQSWLNWSLLDLQRRDMATASRVLALATDPDSAESERCEASDAFTDASFPFYGYPSEQILAQLEILYQRSHGESWCRRDDATPTS